MRRYGFQKSFLALLRDLVSLQTVHQTNKVVINKTKYKNDEYIFIIFILFFVYLKYCLQLYLSDDLFAANQSHVIKLSKTFES